MTEKSQPHPLDDLWSRWEVAQVGRLSASTLRRYRGIFACFVAWFEKEEGVAPTVDDWNPITLVGYRSWLQENRGARTLNTHISALRTWGVWLLEQGHQDTNPAQRLSFVHPQDRAAPAALEPKQVHALLRATRQTRNPARNQALLQTMVQTGMRVGECAALRWGDLEFGERQGFVTIRHSKGNATRRIPLNQSVRQALADYVAPLLKVESTLQEVAIAWKQMPPHEPLWKSERGTPLSVREITRMVQQVVQVCAARGTVPLTTSPHTLRHTFATRYLKRHPGDVIGLAWLLGHRSVRTTQEYVRPTEEEMAQRVSQIDLNAYL